MLKALARGSKGLPRAILPSLRLLRRPQAAPGTTPRHTWELHRLRVRLRFKRLVQNSTHEVRHANIVRQAGAGTVYALTARGSFTRVSTSDCTSSAYAAAWCQRTPGRPTAC